jgi:hypothetical protein
MPQSLLTGQLKEKPTYRVWCLCSSFIHVASLVHHVMTSNCPVQTSSPHLFIQYVMSQLCYPIKFRSFSTIVLFTSHCVRSATILVFMEQLCMSIFQSASVQSPHKIISCHLSITIWSPYFWSARSVIYSWHWGPPRACSEGQHPLYSIIYRPLPFSYHILIHNRKMV